MTNESNLEKRAENINIYQEARNFLGRFSFFQEKESIDKYPKNNALRKDYPIEYNGTFGYPNRSVKDYSFLIHFWGV